ncbi:hypothetical protein LDENG_00025520 [Lucifuga dentata]|nr:hypothetical protein LDENG_00025520 [Lucifuga dentata]
MNEDFKSVSHHHVLSFTFLLIHPSSDHYLRRRKMALWMTVSLLFLSVVILVVGLISATRTDNIPVAGFYAGISLSFGAFLGIVGIHLVENRRSMLTAAIVFISIGVMKSFFCAVVDGIIAAEFIDTRPLREGMCDFFDSGFGYAYDNYYAEVTCHSLNKACKLKVRTNTCYCCHLYSCDSTDYLTYYYEFTGVSSCDDAIHLHHLLWSSVVLNVFGMFVGIITAAILGGFKNMQKQTPQPAPSPVPPPHILYNPTQHMLTYPGFYPPGPVLPTYPNYPIPVQLLPDGGAISTSCPSEDSQSQQPSQAPTQPPSQGDSQDPGGCMLTPNAPALYGASYGPFEKPPPYAC